MNTLRIFTSKQRNLIFNVNEFIKKKLSNIENSFNVNMNNKINTFEEFKFLVIKLIMFNNNQLKFEN